MKDFEVDYMHYQQKQIDSYTFIMQWDDVYNKFSIQIYGQLDMQKIHDSYVLNSCARLYPLLVEL